MNTLTTEQAATHLGIDPVTVRRWVMKGWLTPIRRGTHPLQFRYTDVETARVARLPAEWHTRLDTLAARWEAACLENERA
jgi:excisionase family DNA binding protein